MTIGIYKITNKKTGQIYIGQSINIEKRFKEHIRGKDCLNSYIDNAIKKYGKENFNFEIITQLPNNKKLLNTHEKYWIKFYNTYKDNFHYNLTIGGDGTGSGEDHPNYGNPNNYHHSEETKKKISENHRDNSEENHPFYGKKHSEETKKKMSKALSGENNPNYGKKLSEETKKKMSESKSGENNPMYGKKHSEETKKKMSKAQSGKNHPNYGNPNNYHHSEKTKNKISEALMGENHPAWKNYARIIKYGKVNNKQQYAIMYQGKRIKISFSIDKLKKWFSKNYPNKELRIEVKT